jgi:hypothetical protein
MWEYILFYNFFLATFINYVTHNKTFESEYSLNPTRQKIVEFKLNYFVYKVVNHFLI